MSLIAYLKPVSWNKTCWSGNFNLFDRFIKIRTNLITADASVESSIEVEDGLDFLRTYEKIKKSWKE